MNELQIWVDIDSPEFGLYYTARCPHHVSKIRFTPEEVKALSSEQKVEQLKELHRSVGHCSCELPQ